MESRPESHSTTPDATGELPRSLGDYTLLEEIGSGPRGTTFIASKGTRRCVVKVFRDGAAVDRRLLERFRRGVEGGISHPNLVRVEETGTDDDGHTWIAMCWLRGDTLRDVLNDLRRGHSDRPSLSPLSVGQDGELHPSFLAHAVELLRDVAIGIEALHRNDIVHARLSPDNVILSPTGRLVVTDVGGTSGDIALEAVPYRAPEQLLDTGPLESPRADVWALGALLYELVTFRPPFVDEDEADSPLSHNALVRRIHRASLARPRDVREEIPHDLEECILAAMAPEPEDRYSSAGRLAEDLERFLHGESPIAARSLAFKRQVDGSRAPGFRLAGRLVAAMLLVGMVLVAIHLGGKARSLEERIASERQVLTTLNRGQREEALDLAAELATQHPDNPHIVEFHRALEEAHAREQRFTEDLRVADDARKTAIAQRDAARAAADHRAEAVAAMLEGSLDKAVNSMRSSVKLVPNPDAAAISALIEARARTDPLVRGLEDPRAAVRTATLRDLADELASGRRADGDVQLAMAALRSDSMDEQRAAFAVYGRPGVGSPVLEELEIDATATAPERPVQLAGATFLSLVDVLAAARDDAALAFLATWSFDTAVELDSRVGGSDAIAIRPHVEVDVSAAEGRFARTWIAVKAATDPTALLEQSARITARNDLVRHLAIALRETPGDEAIAELDRIARTRYLEAGREAIDGLTAHAAKNELLGLARDPLPLPLRHIALQRLGNQSAADAEIRTGLVELLTRSPESTLRRAAFDYLSRLDGNDGSDVSESVCAALDDADLRDDALAWLDRIVPPQRARIAVELLGHETAAVRARAIDHLGEDRDPHRASDLLRALLDERASVRQAAVEVLSRRRDLDALREWLEQAEDAARDAVRRWMLTAPTGTAGSTDPESDDAADARDEPGALEQLRSGLERWRTRVRSEGSPAGSD